MTPTPVFTPPSSSSFHPRATSASLSNVNAQQRLLNPPTFIQFKGMQFLIMDAPTDGNLNLYLAHFQPHGVTDMVHACDPTYTIETLESVGIKVHDLNFKDGDPPPPNIVSSWLNLVAHRFQSTSPATSTSSSRTHTFSSSSHFPIHSNPSNGPSSSNSTLNSPVTSAGPTIAIHCVAGLG
ncbi:Protein tyrosine phosphatase type IVA 1, partial [Coelomomyces lativittatus]